MSKKGTCIYCGKPTSRLKTIRCRSCYGKSQRIFESRDKYARNWHLKKKYGMDLEEFEVYWFACRGRCFICGKSMLLPTKTRGQGLDVVAVDHDHKNGKVRGLLCNSCNKALGFFKDDTEILKKAISYLED